jgi:hypothetical protein
MREKFFAAPAAGLALLCILSGCAVVAPRWEVTTVEQRDRGASPASYESAIKRYLQETLKDPDSLQLRIVKGPSQWAIRDAVVTERPNFMVGKGYMRETITDVWLVTAEVNAKNSYGGYTGWQRYEFALVGESIVRATNLHEEQLESERAYDSLIRR